MTEPIRVAMWSGPRNISTAMMYSFDNRTDCHATDEPLYASYLLRSGTPHPGAEEVLREYDTDFSSVTSMLNGPVPGEKGIWYQKHMCHHVPGDSDLSWIDGFSNCFLIRDPREVLSSLSMITRAIDRWSIGLPQQYRIVEHVIETKGRIPPVIDSKDVLINPEGVLSSLCRELGIQFSEEMTSWDPGPRDCDGNWAEYWYQSVWESSGFSPYSTKELDLPSSLESVVEDAQEIYQSLWDLRLVD